MIAKTGRTLPLFLGVFGILSISSDAQAQGNVFNPYGNSGYAAYREFGNPIYAVNPSLPSQSLLNTEPLITRPRANSFQQYVNDLEGSNSGSGISGRNGTSNLPYYQAYQRLNPQFNRVYRPGTSSEDKKFFERQRQRDAAFSAALKERDPVKKARLLRQVEQDSLMKPSTGNTARGSSASRAPNNGGGAPTSADGSRALAAPGLNGSTAAGAANRRPGATDSTLRPPSSTARPGTSGPAATRPRSTRPAPDPSTIPIPAPR